MSKYINADELKLEINREFLNYSQMIEKKKVMSIINELPESVVHCRDCKHYAETGGTRGGCFLFQGMTNPKPDDYCSEGERK